MKRKTMSPGEVTWHLYILRCADDSFYTGVSTDIDRRLGEHQAGTASRYTRSRLPVVLVYVEECGSRSRALAREHAVKSLSRRAKEALIRGKGAVAGSLRLIPILESGIPEEGSVLLPEVARKVCADTASLYAGTGYMPPWIGYLAIRGGEVVGTCAFTSPPKNGCVEIAYFTFSAFEGCGIATAMAGQLLAIARSADSNLQVMAQTLPVPNASNRILQKLGFRFVGAVRHPDEGTVWEWRLDPESRGESC